MEVGGAGDQHQPWVCTALHGQQKPSAAGVCADMLTRVHNVHVLTHRTPDLDTCVYTFLQLHKEALAVMPL